MQHTEIKLNSKEIFKGNVFRVTMDQVELENGMTSFREVVHHNGGACILPLTDDDKVLMVRQYRYALKEELWELPAGKLEKDEDPFEAAKRELEEECGVTAVLQMVMTDEIRDSKTVTAMLKYAWLRQRGEG